MLRAYTHSTDVGALVFSSITLLSRSDLCLPQIVVNPRTNYKSVFHLLSLHGLGEFLFDVP